MRILVSGSTGMVGTALVKALKWQGHEVVRLTRCREAVDEPQVFWDVSKGALNSADLAGIDAVVHLAGENIASGRWTEEKKQKIRNSRVKGTQLLAEMLAKMVTPPKTLVCASAIGFYGNRGDEKLTEVSGPGSGFLSDVCREWEAASAPATAKGVRVAHMRFAMILSPKGGALKAMLPAFQLGVAGNLGSGRQYMSWVALEDVVGAIQHVLATDTLRGPVNVVSPNPLTNAEFTKIMRRVVTCSLSPGKLWAPPAPAFALKLVLGEMAEDLLLASQRVQPVRLLETGYTFQSPELEPALHKML